MMPLSHTEKQIHHGTWSLGLQGIGYCFPFPGMCFPFADWGEVRTADVGDGGGCQWCIACFYQAHGQFPLPCSGCLCGISIKKWTGHMQFLRRGTKIKSQESADGIWCILVLEKTGLQIHRSHIFLAIIIIVYRYHILCEDLLCGGRQPTPRTSRCIVYDHKMILL